MEIKPSREVNLGGFQGRESSRANKKTSDGQCSGTGVGGSKKSRLINTWGQSGYLKLTDQGEGDHHLLPETNSSTLITPYVLTSKL